jgi:O-acetyl-ADP-ribose deacetylase (regulator of RNase III)
MRRAPLKELYYITHINNLPSILKRGILSHELVKAENVPFISIYADDIVAKRREIKTPDGRSLWSFANLYFQARNPMLYKVVFFSESTDANDIAVLGVQMSVLNKPDIFISTGNAASASSVILPAREGKKALSQIRKDIDKEYWTEESGSKRKIMAECLIPGIIPPELITEIYVASHEAADKVRPMVEKFGLSVVHHPSMFFQPFRKIDLTPYISLVEGDMFFSRMQTVTVSVNCVGVMGKGLASRAKYQFSDVYVYYQDLCRKGILQMGKPRIYKRESSFDYQLADEPATLSNANSETWFLLFPTKQDWRERADIIGIEKGLQWLRDNYKKEDMKSLAIPALGCGLGRLDWRDVGPLMCKYLTSLDIQVWIYLPAEKKVPDELLSKDFLLRHGS